MIFEFKRCPYRGRREVYSRRRREERRIKCYFIEAGLEVMHKVDK